MKCNHQSDRRLSESQDHSPQALEGNPGLGFPASLFNSCVTLQHLSVPHFHPLSRPGLYLCYLYNYLIMERSLVVPLYHIHIHYFLFPNILLKTQIREVKG